MSYYTLINRFTKSLRNKDLKSSLDILSNASEFIKHNYDTVYQPLETFLLTYQVCLDIEYSEFVIELLNLSEETVIGRLQVAVARRDFDSIISLLSSNRVNLSDLDDEDTLTLVRLAFGRWGDIQHTRTKLLEVLIKNGLNVRAKAKFGKNLLHVFFSNFGLVNDPDSQEVVNLLLDAGIPLNETDDHYYTILHTVAEVSNQLSRFSWRVLERTWT